MFFLNRASTVAVDANLLSAISLSSFFKRSSISGCDANSPCFSVDPLLWVKDAGGQTLLYMRYEDVGVVTDKGFENFSDFMPTSLEELERTVRLKGIVQDYPPSAMPWNAP